MNDRYGPLVKVLLEGGIFLEQSVELLERAMIEGALLRADGNQSAASKALGIHRNTIQRKIAEYKLSGSKARPKPMARVTRRVSSKRKVS